MTKTEALEIIGGLSEPSKMPCHGYSIPASRCITGSKLRDVEGSICSLCYAHRANYLYKNVQASLERRFQSLSDPRWVSAAAAAITYCEKSGHFRWHDSGDLQSELHFDQIAQVCRLTPGIRHWLPTREYAFVSSWLNKGNMLPDNLTVRFSSLMFEGPAPAIIARRCGVQVSGSSKHNYNCPASGQGNQCGGCRACWDRGHFNITYKRH